MSLSTNKFEGLQVDEAAFSLKWLKTGSFTFLQRVAFYFAYLLFAVVGLVTSLSSSLIAVVARSAAARRSGQRLIHSLFSFFVWYVRTCGLLRLEAAGLEALRDRKNLIIAANHPSLLDAVFIAAHLPNVFCIMKASLVHNIVLCGQAKLAGYVNNQSGVRLIKSCQARMREGSNLLVFPEGTRTRGQRLEDFKLGFVLLSRASKAPIQTVLIHYDHRFLGKNWPFFKPPPFPLHCTISLGREFHPKEHSDSAAYAREIEAYLRGAVLKRQTSAARTPCHE